MAATHQLKVIRPTSKNAQVRRVKQGTPATHPLTVDSKGRLIPKLYSKTWAPRDATIVLVAFRHGLRAVSGWPV